MRNKSEGQCGDNPSDRATGRFEDQHQADGPHDDVPLRFAASPITERLTTGPQALERRFELEHDIPAGDNNRRGQHAVQHPQGSPVFQLLVQRALKKTDHQAHQDEQSQCRLLLQSRVVHLENREEAQRHPEHGHNTLAKPISHGLGTPLPTHFALASFDSAASPADFSASAAESAPSLSGQIPISL